MIKHYCASIVTTVGICGSAFAAVKSDYSIGFHQFGKEAQATYKALMVPEQIEKYSNQLQGNSKEIKTYKIGKNILCLKILENEREAYFCSSGFNSLGESENSTEGL